MNIQVDLTTPEDFEYFQKWFNDQEIMKWFPSVFQDLDYNIAFHSFWIKKKDNLVFTIKESGRPIGYVGAEMIDRRNKNALLQILLGDRSYHGKGVAVKAGNIFLQKMFSEHDFHSLSIWIVEENLSSIRTAERNGFKRVGVQRESHFMEGIFKNRIILDLLKEDFLKLNGGEKTDIKDSSGCEAS